MNPIYETLTLDRTIPVPLYYQLKQFMIDNIKNNVLKEGEAVPTEEELCALLEISRPTVRQAFSALVNEGYLDRIKAKGTFITRPKIQGNFFQNIESYNKEMKNKGLEPSTRLLSIEETSAYPEVLEKLELPRGSKVIRIERLRFANQTPIVHVTTYVPYKPFKGLLKEHLDQDSLYEILGSKFDTYAQRVTRNVQAIIANQQMAALLNVPQDSPLLYIITTAFSQSGEPFEYSLATYRSDLYSLNLELIRHGNP